MDQMVMVGGTKATIPWGTLPVGTPVNAVAATGVLTVSGTPEDDGTVSIGPVTYTWKAELSDDPAVPHEVKIGVSAEASIDNLVAAINGGDGEGSVYGEGTAAHPLVSAAKTTAAAMTVTARTRGAAANAVELAEIGEETEWDEDTLTGGVNSTPAPAGGACVDEEYLYVSKGQSAASTQNWRRVALGSAY